MTDFGFSPPFFFTALYFLEIYQFGWKWYLTLAMSIYSCKRWNMIKKESVNWNVFQCLAEENDANNYVRVSSNRVVIVNLKEKFYSRMEKSLILAQGIASSSDWVSTTKQQENWFIHTQIMRQINLVYEKLVTDNHFSDWTFKWSHHIVEPTQIRMESEQNPCFCKWVIWCL